jgi:hypothetical protein
MECNEVYHVVQAIAILMDQNIDKMDRIFWFFENRRKKK